MIFLVDSSVWLEVLLDQANAPEARAFLGAVAPSKMAVSIFALHSIGVVLVRRGKSAAYEPFVNDLIIRNSVNVLTLPIPVLPEVTSACTKLGLDFDDAYQSVIAEQHGLTVVSFDAHFDRTPRGRVTPSQAFSMDEKGKS